MSDCRFGVSPVNYPDLDPDVDRGGGQWLQMTGALNERLSLSE